MGSGAELVNARGDKISLGSGDPRYGGQSTDPVRRADLLSNWLTAGGLPKPIDPGLLFAQEQQTSGVRAKAAAGMGINGLFGVGNFIGDLVPKIQPIEPLKPLNQSPMQTGVPYSAPPVGGGKR